MLFSMYEKCPPTPPNTPNQEDYDLNIFQEKATNDVLKVIAILTLLETLNIKCKEFTPKLKQNLKHFDKINTLYKKISAMENKEEKKIKLSQLKRFLLEEDEFGFECCLEALEDFFLI